MAARTAAAVAGLLTMFMPRWTPAAMSSGVQPCELGWFQTSTSAPASASSVTTLGTCL
jgi:hypothetical protein